MCISKAKFSSKCFLPLQFPNVHKHSCFVLLFNGNTVWNLVLIQPTQIIITYFDIMDYNFLQMSMKIICNQFSIIHIWISHVVDSAGTFQISMRFPYYSVGVQAQRTWHRKIKCWWYETENLISSPHSLIFCVHGHTALDSSSVEVW